MGVGGKLISDLEMREWERLFGYMAGYFHIHTFRIFFCDASSGKMNFHSSYRTYNTDKCYVM
jgi:hypothetical protein